MCNIGILPQRGRYLTTMMYQLLLPITNKLDDKIIAKTYLLVSLTNITMTKDSITDYLLLSEGS
jgi:hypothetical protein